MKEETKIIIPAAGFGTRVGTPEAKELLPLINNRPMILNAIHLAQNLNCRAHVITRAEKKSLIAYLADFPFVDIQIITPSKEWPDTILQSSSYWSDKNILILPDTVWSPLDVIHEINLALDHHSIAIGSFNPEDKKTWGVFKNDSSKYELCEKPQSSCSLNVRAWGILGFKKEAGKELFEKVLSSTFDHEWKSTEFNYKEFPLNSFADLTR